MATVFASSGGDTALGWVMLVGIFVAFFGYHAFLRSGMTSRTVMTSLGRDAVVDIFTRKVASAGWHLIEGDGQYVAQSSLATGIRQQMSLTFEVDPRHPDRLAARIQVSRFSKKILGGPTKAHTLRIRRDAFCNGVRRADPTAVVLTDQARASAPLTKGVPSTAAPEAALPVRTITSIGDYGAPTATPFDSTSYGTHPEAPVLHLSLVKPTGPDASAFTSRSGFPMAESGGGSPILFPAPVAPAGATSRLKGSMVKIGPRCPACGAHVMQSAAFCTVCGSSMATH